MLLSTARLFLSALLVQSILMTAIATAQSVSRAPSNPLEAASTLPFGAPPFDRIKDTDFEPALEAGMTQELAEIDAIAGNPRKPTFDNTIVAMEKSGRLLARVNQLFQNLVAANSNDTLQALNTKEAPLLQAHSDAILLNPTLFGRIEALYDKRASLGLKPSDVFLIERWRQKFVRAGAKLNEADKARLRAINGDIAALQAEFQSTLLKAANDGAVVVSDKAELAGLSDAGVAAAASAAKSRNLDGQYVLALRNTTQQPIAASLQNRPLRQRLLAASEARGDAAGPTDLRDVIATLAQKRAERAKILGYPSHAAYVLDDQMAKTPAAAEKLLTDLVPAATAKANEEAGEIQALIDQQKGGFTLTAADWEFYADQVRKAKYDLDDNEVRQYFELDKVLSDGVFFAANKLYGLTFKPRTDLPVYQPDVKVFEVFDANGQSLALFYVDYFARPNKQGGAWCNYVNVPSGLEGSKPIIYNVANFTKPEAGQPALISFDDVTTMFHEFGHALHAMFSVQRYPSQNGFNLPTDVIEFPSQFNEHWALEPHVLASYARHYQTGAPIPDALVAKIKAARTYGKGYATTELLAAALLDLDWHSLPADAPKQIPDVFEAASLKKNHVDLPAVPPRYRSTYFLHIWGNGYDSNYYSYTWGEILDDDAYEWFTDNGGLTRANGQRFRDMMLGPGYTENPMTLYHAFRGRDPSAEALKRERGLAG
jgi:peptidyl-dipeptidase Dcp